MAVAQARSPGWAAPRLRVEMLIHFERKDTLRIALVITLYSGLTEGALQAVHLRFENLRKTDNQRSLQLARMGTSHNGGQVNAACFST